MVRLLIHTCGFIVLSLEGRAVWLALLWRRTAAMWVQGVCLHAMCCPSTTAVTLQDRDSQTDNVGVVILRDSVAVFFPYSHLALFSVSFLQEPQEYTPEILYTIMGFAGLVYKSTGVQMGEPVIFYFEIVFFFPLLFFHSKVRVSNRTSGMLNQCPSTQDPFICAFLTLTSHTHPVYPAHSYFHLCSYSIHSCRHPLITYQLCLFPFFMMFLLQ